MSGRSERPPPIDPSAAPEPAAARPRSSVETRRRLLDAALREFAQKGFAGARLREIAGAAGVQQALIHHYFSDKGGLYRAVLDRAIADTAEGGWRILERGREPTPTIEAFVELLVRFSATHADLLAILRLEAASGEGVALDVMRARTKPILDAVEQKLAAWQAAGVFGRHVAAREIIVAVLALTVFPYQEAALLDALWPGTPGARDDEAAIARRCRMVVDVVTRGLLNG
ncbi:MAG: TetR/AcrR family transcriptional regulator [Polyangiaceae bacterium]|nr:TetR/AcrR family transcriptional regulator [Polyangiaceae bacterium]